MSAKTNCRVKDVSVANDRTHLKHKWVGIRDLHHNLWAIVKMQTGTSESSLGIGTLIHK